VKESFARFGERAVRPLPGVRLRVSESARVDLWLARVMLGVALVVCLGLGVQHARHDAAFGPIDEVYHVAYAEHVANTGEPPVFGRDTVVHDAKPTSTDTVVRAPESGGFPPGWPPGQRLGQVEAIQPPLYYYVLAPIAWVVPWHHRVGAYRTATIMLVAAGIGFLYAAVRLSAPERPLAAGLAAVVLASMSGINYALSEVQNDGLLLGLFCVDYWAFIRWREGRGSGRWVALVSGLLVMTQLVAGPIALGLTVLSAGLPGLKGARARTRRLASRLALFVAPAVPWVLWNLWQYHYLWPVSVTKGGPAGPSQAPQLDQLLPLVTTAAEQQFHEFWSIGFIPPNSDLRPPALLAFAIGASAVCLLMRDRLQPEGRRIATWLGLMLAAFASSYAVIVFSSIKTGGSVSFVGRYFVGVAVAYAAVAGLAITAALERREWLQRIAAVAGSYVLIGWALQYSVVTLRLW
jgi:4-amino-4-deoxy-L-arabinose transferase-like glycosyltransferase